MADEHTWRPPPQGEPVRQPEPVRQAGAGQQGGPVRQAGAGQQGGPVRQAGAGQQGGPVRQGARGRGSAPPATPEPVDAQARRADLAATLGASRELGRDYDDALAASFLDRLDHDLDARIAAHLAAAGTGRGSGGDSTLPLAIASLVFAIPLSGIGGGTGGLPGLLLVWVGIVAVNAAAALSRRPR